MDVPREGPVDDELVAELKVRMRQRRAEVAAQEASGRGPGLADLETSQHLEEPVPFSARRGLGPLVVAARKAVAALFLRWYSRPLLEQQSAFNRAASLRIQELVESERRLRRRLDALEERLGGSDGPGS